MLNSAARTEHVSAFAGIVAVAFGVDDVIDAVEKKAERKDDVEKSRPEGHVAPIEGMTERNEIKENGGGPETGARDLDEKFCSGKKIVSSERLGRRLGGDAHLEG